MAARIYLENWNCKSFADANGDGYISFHDIVAIKRHWGEINDGFNFLENLDCESDEGISACNDVFNRNFESMNRGEIQEFILDLFGDNSIPEKFIIQENYPNPFNPITKIVYELPEFSQIRIEIINMRGQIIDQYIRKDIQPGIYDYIWDASGNSTGIYIFRFYSNGQLTNQQKMVFIK